MNRKINPPGFSGFLIALLLTCAAAAQTRSPEAIATLKFYPAAQGNSFAVGASPSSVVFDGSSIWVSNGPSRSLTKRRASDGAMLGSFQVGLSPGGGVAFDGVSIWVSNSFDNTVTRLRATDGTN